MVEAAICYVLVDLGCKSITNLIWLQQLKTLVPRILWRSIVEENTKQFVREFIRKVGFDEKFKEVMEILMREDQVDEFKCRVDPNSGDLICEISEKQAVALESAESGPKRIVFKVVSETIGQDAFDTSESDLSS